jgi:hypothetical protein
MDQCVQQAVVLTRGFVNRKASVVVNWSVLLLLHTGLCL